MPVVEANQLRNLAISLFKAAGAGEGEAKAVTEQLMWASLHGHDSHGVGHLSSYVRNYLGTSPLGRVEKNASFTISETPATVTLNANWGVGQRAVLTATDMIIEKAEKVGIAAASVFRNTHTGALGFYVNRIADRGMIGLMFTCSGAASPPFGGVERLLGTNPMAIGIPAGREYPIIIDMATSSRTWVGIGAILASGAPLPSGLLDDDGEPTTDPDKFSGGALGGRGSMDNLAGNHKGYAVQLAVELLGGILPALITSNDILKIEEGVVHIPAFLIAINVSFFQNPDEFAAKVDARIRELRDSRKKKGVEAIYLPGERGFRTQEQRLKEGIPISDHYWRQIAELAQQLNIDLPASAKVTA